MTDAVPSPERDIELRDTYNLRDLGGYRTGDGRQVRWRLLFRGAGLQRLDGPDLETVRGLGLVTAVDLRTQGEVDRHGAYPVDQLPAAFHHLPMIRQVWDIDQLDPEAGPDQFLLARYQDMLKEGARAISLTFEILADPENLPAVFYCAAGKDRTGVLAALVLSALGVQREAIVADYHLSKERVDRIRARALKSAGDGLSTMIVQPEPFMQAPAGAMRLLLGWIADVHGTTAAYLTSVGVSLAAIEAMKHNLLEPAP
jgi:protein-tyrosine phosphatase